MDWSIPQTFYPSALPGPVTWALFLLALSVAGGASWMTARRRGWKIALLLLGPITACTVFASMIVSMVLAFFVHDV